MITEAVAEETKTPLLLYPAGELGSRLSEIESEIKRLVRYATVWKAVLLIDEADVFLESRQSAGQTSLERNALVAGIFPPWRHEIPMLKLALVFLRQLEYFQGIIFLTSNRAQNFDAAIKSRIHLTIQYTAPDATLRRKLWRQKLEPLLNQGQCILDTNKTIEVVSKYEMNGREISNTVNSARTVAADSGDVLKLEHLEVVLKVWKESQTVVDKDKSFLKKPSPWMLRLMAAVMFGAALRLSFLGFKRLRNRGILRRSR
jgi:AAA+ superfamily predicted ATPase